MNNVLFYLQHYLAPSMTFIYRQLKGIETLYHPIVFCSDRKENVDEFPFEKIYHKRRNFIQVKKSKYYKKLFGNHTLLNTNPKLSFNQRKYLDNLIDRHNIKLIHAHFGPSGLEIVKFAQKKGIPLVVTFHGYDASVLLTMKRYTKNILKVFNYAYIIAVSENMKTELMKYGANENDVTVIRCGIPVEEFQFIKRESLLSKKRANSMISFLQVSSFVEKKGHIYTIRAFKEFLQSYPNAKLTLAGDGYLRQNVQNLCSELGIYDKVVFPGNVDYRNVPGLMKSADVFLHHSVTSQNGDKEGIPTVVMEAMASGLPTISTYHSGIPELIDNNENGLLVNEKDVNGYTGKMLDILNDNGRLGLNARKKIEHSFNLKIQNDKLISFYESIMKKAL